VRISLALLLLITSSTLAEESAPKRAAHVVRKELHRYVHDAKSIATAPLHWTSAQWTRFGEGTATVAMLYAADPRLSDVVQRNRSSATDNFARVITPFGGRRAQYISALLIIGGAASHDEAMRDAGRDSLEAEIIAAGIVTPLLKRGFGRARPIQDEGARSFHPFSSEHESFPSGHATNAFAFATGIASHYDNWIVPTIVYSVATGVAMSRVNDRAHFVSDVVAGALIGRAIAKGIVRHDENGKTAWTLTPAVVNGRPALFVRIHR